VQRVEENVDAADLELTSDEPAEIEDAAAQIQVQRTATRGISSG
jgi:hypothetical protein